MENDTVDDTGYPGALTTLPQWCNWDERKHPTPKVGSTRLLTFTEAFRRDPDHVGFHFTKADPYAGIDIDAMTPLAQQILSAARERGAYIARSPSGEGWHIIGRGVLERAIGKGKADPGVEAYDDRRYFTMPRTRHGGNPDVVIQDLLDLLVERRMADRREPAQPPAQAEQWDEAVHRSALDALDPSCGYDDWLAVGMALHAGGAPFEVWDEWSMQSDKHPGTDEVRAKWDSFNGGGRTLGSMLALAREQGWSEFGGAEDLFDIVPDTPKPDPKPNAWLRALVWAHTLTDAPPPRQWAWEQWIPRGVVTGLAGEPGVAKSTLALQLCVHHCLGLEYLGHAVGQGPATFITVEDDADELHRRYHRICDGLFIDPDHVQGLALVSATEMITELVAVPRDGSPKGTKLLKDLRALLLDTGSKFLVLDLIGDFWGGSENNRGEVGAYVRHHLGRLASALNIGVLGISHLNKLGVVSGSTAWLGSYRSAMTMVRAPHERIHLLREKANYAPPMETPQVLRWVEGYVAEVSEGELRAEALEHDDLALAALPADEWLGVRALQELWGIGAGQVRRRARAFVEAGLLDTREHGGRPQWMKVPQVEGQ